MHFGGVTPCLHRSYYGSHRRRALMASGNWILASFDPYTFSHSQGQELTSTSFAHDVRKNPKSSHFACPSLESRAHVECDGFGTPRKERQKPAAACSPSS